MHQKFTMRNHFKKNILFLFLVINSYQLSAQTVVQGSLEQLTADSLIFYYSYHGKIQKVCLPVIDGKFTWAVDLREPVMISAYLPVLSTTMKYAFYAEPGNMTLTGSVRSKETFRDIKISGSRTQHEYEKYNALVAVKYKEYLDLNEQIKRLPLAKRAGLESKLELARLEYSLIIPETFIKSNPNSYLSADLLFDLSSKSKGEMISELYKLLGAKVKESYAGKQVLRYLGAIKNAALGESVSDFELKDEEGNSIRFSDFKGKYVLIDFWASWCAPCRAENPNLLRAYDKYKNSNFTVVGISVDKDKSKWGKAIKEDGMPWIQLIDERKENGGIIDHYGIKTIPASFLVNPAGQIIGKNLRGNALDAKLEEVLNGAKP
ncbi:TlpA disulfide reductase family protein [Pedobacter sp. MC2016-24]|uniref:TlpA disulfide reductase family protein n=1 Tax=Pedobacter sp. MC2016-24 TaxID=2780090 RepID=UPI00187E8997|nr:TlpA disulfide reductase family protein [Pedobacter sp. MC2016-24]MBE9601581.1 AhpC/TSA family protein [Pedobacter sp. MC2016-24]